MPWRLDTTSSFDRELKKLSPADAAKIIAAAKAMVTNPGNADIKKLEGNLWRLRVGSFRVFLILDTATGRIIFVGVQRRSSKTY